MNKKQNLAFFLILSLISQIGWARVDLKKTKVLILPDEMSSSIMSEETKNKILPKTVSSDTTGQQVLAQMADNSASLIWNTSDLKKTSLGRAADNAEKKLNMQKTIEGKNNVNHSFSFKVLALQTLARLEYSGWFKGAISYDAHAAKTEAEFSEKINKNQDFVISQSITTAESKSKVGVRWDW